MRVLVTGGLGFLGKAAALRLARAGHRVLTLDAGVGAAPDPLEAVTCDIGDPIATVAAFERFQPEAVVHLAALLTPESAVDIVAATRTNALGTASVFEAARRIGAMRLVYASSIAAVGTLREPTGDAVALCPTSVYGATKAFSEHLATALAASGWSIPMVGLRFGWIYGSGRTRGWRDVQALVEAVALGERSIIYPDFADPIDWTWVDDAAEVMAHALEADTRGHRVFNVAGDRRPVRDAIAHLSTRFPDLVATPRHAATPPAAWTLHNDGLQAAIGYVPVTKLEEGLDRLIAEVRAKALQQKGAPA